MTYYLLSVLTGALIAAMIVVNGALTGVYGVYLATLIIHVVGLLVITAGCLVRRQRLWPRGRLPLWLYLGGVIGVLTTVCNNLSFGRISLSAIVALGLLGQAAASLLIDQFGLLGMERRPFRPAKLSGLFCVLLGTGYMLWGSAFDPMPVLMSLLAGVAVVLSRTVNARLSAYATEMASTFVNYAVGLFFAAAALLWLGRAELSAPFALSPRAWIYLGGALGVLVVVLLNLTVARISALYMTLLLFVGQMFSGVAVDMALTRSFSPQNLVGGVLVAAGMGVNLWLDQSGKARAA